MNSQINSEGNIILHFDTRQDLRVHCDTLISSLEAVKTAANFVSQNCFGKQYKVKLGTVYVEEGSFKIIIWFSIGIGIWHEVNRFLNTPLGKYVCEKKIKKEGTPIIPKQYEKVISYTSKAILETPAKEMRVVYSNCTFNNCTFPNFPLKKVIEDKNKFYQSAREDENILGIEFKDEHEFPINRENIDKYIDNTLPEQSTTIAYKELILVSPVLDRNSQKKWSFKTSNDQTQSYEMQDPSFLEKTLRGDYAFKEGTKIEAKIRIKRKADETVYSILDIYTVDGKEEKPKPKDFELSAIINNPTDISTQQTLSF